MSDWDGTWVYFDAETGRIIEIVTILNGKQV